MPDPRLRRTLLMTPGNREDRLRKAATYAADALVYDLEDGVPPNEKAAARHRVAAALREIAASPAEPTEAHGRERCVRINALDTPYGIEDLASLPFDLIDSIMVPKVESADMLRDIDARLAALHADRARERPIELIALIETPRGILRALEIADAVPRTTALFFGSGDYTSALGADVTETTLHYPRSVITAAAAAAGIQAIDAAFFQDVKNAQATRDDALIARALGFSGKVVFHPNQIDVVNNVFSPSPTEIENARRLLAAYEAQLARGHGTSVTAGAFVAVDLIAPAKRLLRLAEAITQRAGGATTSNISVEASAPAAASASASTSPTPAPAAASASTSPTPSAAAPTPAPASAAAATVAGQAPTPASNAAPSPPHSSSRGPSS